MEDGLSTRNVSTFMVTAHNTPCYSCKRGASLRNMRGRSCLGAIALLRRRPFSVNWTPTLDRMLGSPAFAAEATPPDCPFSMAFSRAFSSFLHSVGGEFQLFMKDWGGLSRIRVCVGHINAKLGSCSTTAASPPSSSPKLVRSGT